ncbi:MAG TPA: hemerythrin domain-containing protein [Sphingomicrobium sp.]|jgi:hemerythrin superfamily protein|nr:hemerythrin domain-containing protein [Sphingomicrobium sp.]
MATRTQSATSNRSNSNRSRNRGGGSPSAFSWGEGAGPIIAAALGGAAIGFAANYGRKALQQGIEASIGDWDEILASEHDAALALFDRILETDDSQTFKRKMLFMKLSHALDKHSHAEEMVVYPALRGDDSAVDADHLESEHGYIKTFIFDLNEMGPASPNWLKTVRDFRQLVAEHAQMEEEQVFPKFKGDMSEDENARITSLVNRDGFWMA